MRIVASAPTRIGLFGGGTDVDPFASQFGGRVLSLSVNLNHTGILEPNKNATVSIKAMGEIRKIPLGKRLDYGRNPKFDLHYAVVHQFLERIPSGLSYTDVFDAKHSSGLGSSGSAAVSMIGALSHWLKLGMSRMEIAMLAWKMEAEELGWISGKQDQLASVFGGVNLFTFGPGDKTSVEPLQLSKDTLEELREWMLLGYIPGRRHSGQLQKKLRKGMGEKDKQKALIGLRDSVDLAVRALKRRDWQRLGRLLDQAWGQKKKSNPAVTNPRIDRIYTLAKASGALGGKIMGAGGAGHMFFLVPPTSRENLRQKLIANGLEVVPFDFDFQGLQVRKYSGKIKKTHKVDVRRGFSPRRHAQAVFLDRDGVVSREKHLVHRLKDFELLPGTAEAIKRLNEQGIPVIVYHNASVVARGLCGEEQVVRLHQKMKRLLAKKRACVDMIIYCPHHPKAFNPKFQYDCEWRKPNSGMLRFAKKEFGFDLGKSFVVGDTARDILMGQSENAYSILVRTGHAGQDTLYEAKPGRTVENLYEAVSFILKKLGK